MASINATKTADVIHVSYAGIAKTIVKFAKRGDGHIDYAPLSIKG